MGSEKIILGIDPGTNMMGYGLLKVKGNRAEMMAMGVIDMRKQSDPYLRLGGSRATPICAWAISSKG